MPPIRRLFGTAALALGLAGAALLCSLPAAAGTEPSYQDPLTAAPPIARPATPACTVTVMQNFAFNSSVGNGGSAAGRA